ncbi:MAG: hypothetical protein ABFS05_04365 [Bacteroidota bacterium]
MNILSIKKELLQACIAEIDERTDSLKKVMEEAQQSANDYGQPKDRYDSYRAQLLRKRDMFGQQLQKILEQRMVLEKIGTEKKHTLASFGAIVITDTRKIFISVGLGKLELEGEEYFVISPAVPFFKAIEGKKPGDSFEFRNQKFSILEIG